MAIEEDSVRTKRNLRICAVGDMSLKHQALTVEEKESIIHCIIAKLRTDVSNVDAFQRFMGLHVADLAYKRMRTIGFSNNYELCHYDGMICSTSE